MLQTVNDKTMLSDGAYSIGKKLVLVWIPAFSSLYFGMGNIWGLPAVEQVIGSCALIATFLGVVLGISSHQYDKTDAGFDGEVHVSTVGGVKNYSLAVNGDIPLENLDQKDQLKLKIITPGASK